RLDRGVPGVWDDGVGVSERDTMPQSGETPQPMLDALHRASEPRRVTVARSSRATGTDHSRERFLPGGSHPGDRWIAARISVVRSNGAHSATSSGLGIEHIAFQK